MRRKVVSATIDKCNRCPHQRMRECEAVKTRLGNKALRPDWQGVMPIPSWCPLPDAPKEAE